MKNSIIFTALLLLLLAVSLLSLCLGAVRISIPELLSIIGHKVGFGSEVLFRPQQEAVFINIRLPRVLLGMLVGSALAVSGAVIQGLFRNPLAEPGLIGISSGAMLSAALLIVLEVPVILAMKAFLGYYALAFAAFLGACLTTWIVYRLSMRSGKADITTLLLAGIAINALSGAFTGLLIYLANDEQLRNITFWSMGSLGGANWKTVSTIVPFAIIPIAILPFFAKSINALALGEAQAMHMGINVHMLKRIVIILATLGVGASVAVSGLIGFVGLVVPHIIRMAFSSDHRLVIPASALLGAVVLVFADLVARTIVSPAELPIGILTAMIGTPIFIYIIMRERKKRFF
ncbi:iron ABC transporter permease [Sphingobacterium sp. JB170]|uniref:FecCD family ABC transporter permease n=1 Tax=Sphingobacterium sp. JB170 TaxID=1434842 RepID=UPI00097E94CF|nr:iron ABC transporter permease [Sphingobacterium sp. JB170]SJN22667.1 Hemin ABC transporter, permease protein [Sphingobacterium sp. JB170]